MALYILYRVVSYFYKIVPINLKFEELEAIWNNLPATDNWVMSIAPTQIHLAVSAPKATGSDWK